MNRRIENSFERLGPVAGQVEVDYAVWYATGDTAQFWGTNLDRFPISPQFQRKRRNALCVERIFPLPKPIRDNLVDLYCRKNGCESARSYQANKALGVDSSPGILSAKLQFASRSDSFSKLD